jgi:hypothetical protein
MRSAHSITSTTIQLLVDICVELKINIPKKKFYIYYLKEFMKFSCNQICQVHHFFIHKHFNWIENTHSHQGFFSKIYISKSWQKFPKKNKKLDKFIRAKKISYFFKLAILWVVLTPHIPMTIPTCSNGNRGWWHHLGSYSHVNLFIK